MKSVNYPNSLINNINIERVVDFKFLRIEVRQRLKWNKYQHNNVGVATRLKYEYPQRILKNKHFTTHYFGGIYDMAFYYGAQKLKRIHKIQEELY